MSATRGIIVGSFGFVSLADVCEELTEVVIIGIHSTSTIGSLEASEGCHIGNSHIVGCHCALRERQLLHQKLQLALHLLHCQRR